MEIAVAPPRVSKLLPVAARESYMPAKKFLPLSSPVLLGALRFAQQRATPRHSRGREARFKRPDCRRASACAVRIGYTGAETSFPPMATC